MNFVHKAQHLAFRRWFTKQQPGVAQISDAEKDKASLCIESGEAIVIEKAGSSYQEQPRNDVVHAKPGDISTADDESEDQERAPASSRAVCDGMAFGEDILIGELSSDEYTETGGGIVIGSDGTKKCPVLLLTYDMSIGMQKVLNLQRVVSKQEREANAKLEALANYETALRREIQNHQALIDKAEAGGDSSAINAADEPNFAESLQEELENLKRLLQGAENRKIVVDANLTSRRNLLQKYQDDVNKHIEVAFVYAQVVEEASEEEDFEVPEISVQEEYQSLVIKMQDLHGISVAERSFTSTTERIETPMPAISPERQARIAASKALWEAEQDRQYARVQFEERNVNRERELQQTIAAEQRGELVPFSSVEEFDLSWVVRFREITRELLDAEKRVSQARAAAKEAGLSLEHDTQSSCFPDDPADGQLELMSSENDSPETFAGDPRMIAWMDSLDDSGNPEFWEPADVDEWGSGAEVVDSDSASVVAYGSERRRIDAWQRVGCSTATMALEGS